MRIENYAKAQSHSKSDKQKTNLAQTAGLRHFLETISQTEVYTIVYLHHICVDVCMFTKNYLIHLSFKTTTQYRRMYVYAATHIRKSILAYIIHLALKPRIYTTHALGHTHDAAVLKHSH